MEPRQSRSAAEGVQPPGHQAPPVRPAGSRCACCGDTKDYADCQVDHVQPRAEGGSDNLDNLQILCGPCNREQAAGLDFDAKVMSAKALKARRDALQAHRDEFCAELDAAIARVDSAEQAKREIANRRRRDRGYGRAA